MSARRPANTNGRSMILFIHFGHLQLRRKEVFAITHYTNEKNDSGTAAERLHAISRQTQDENGWHFDEQDWYPDETGKNWQQLPKLVCTPGEPCTSSSTVSFPMYREIKGPTDGGTSVIDGSHRYVWYLLAKLRYLVASKKRGAAYPRTFEERSHWFWVEALSNQNIAVPNTAAAEKLKEDGWDTQYFMNEVPSRKTAPSGKKVKSTNAWWSGRRNITTTPIILPRRT